MTNKFKYEVINNGETIQVLSNEKLNDSQLMQYVELIKTQHRGETIEKIEFNFCGDNVSAVSTMAPIKFDKIRRITGYLVGTLDRFNDGKKAEEHDRVKHNI